MRRVTERIVVLQRLVERSCNAIRVEDLTMVRDYGIVTEMT